MDEMRGDGVLAFCCVMITTAGMVAAAAAAAAARRGVNIGSHEINNGISMHDLYIRQQTHCLLYYHHQLLLCLERARVVHKMAIIPLTKLGYQ